MPHAITGQYSEDLYMSNPANLISNEIQTLQTPGADDYQFIIPFAAPFYVESLELRRHSAGTLLVEGEDYLIGHRFVEAMKSLKRPIAGSIRIMKAAITGSLRIKYHTVGGQWGFSENKIVAELSARTVNPVIRAWGDIDVLPYSFPSIPHDQSVDKIIDSAKIKLSIDDIANAITAGNAGSTNAHIADHNNPHQVTKAQTGLGDVQNYPVASIAEAKNNGVSNRYMTPQTTYEAIVTFAGNLLNQHLNDHNNPHQVTKAQVGLGSVQNYPIANNTQAVDATNNSVYVTPYSAYLMFQQAFPEGRIALIESNITTHTGQISGLQTEMGTKVTEPQVQDMIAAINAGDANTFGGKTYSQFMALVVEESEMIQMLNQWKTKIENGKNLINTVNPNIGSQVEQGVMDRKGNLLTEGAVGNNGYVLLNSKGGGVIKHLTVSPYIFPLASGYETDHVAFSNIGFRRIESNGAVQTFGSLAAVNNAYKYGDSAFVPANACKKIFVSYSNNYLLTVDGRLLRSNNPGDLVQIATNVSDAWANVLDMNNIGIYKSGNTLAGFGNPQWVSQVAGPLNSLTGLGTITSIALTDRRITAMYDDSNARSIPFTRSGTNYNFSSVVTHTSVDSVYGYHAATSIMGLDGIVNALDGVIPATDGIAKIRAEDVYICNSFALVKNTDDAWDVYHTFDSDFDKYSD